jgi:lysophospholipase L1-like esterase
MSHLTGREWTNFGAGGSSTKSWMNGGGKLAEVQATGNKCQAYVIGLGINDISNPATQVSLGTSADIGTDADSYYAYYYKLVKAVYAVNNDAKIFCSTLPQPTLTNVSGYNQAVKDIVAQCKTEGISIWLLDLAGEYYTDDLYANNMYTTDRINSHYTPIGYNFMAECYRDVISDVINKNVSAFQNVFLIDYDEST